MCPGDRDARVDRQRDGKSPEKSCAQQPGQEAVLPTGDRIRNETIAEKHEDEDAQHFAQVLFRPAFFRYRHVSSSFDCVVRRQLAVCPLSIPPPWPARATKKP